ncbi:MAG: NAD-dependent protein deacylase [Flavobacterium sp. BFFFF2]|nr:MAG: NAD-dependent protein deacylase [Flavobacterium sp. BFFFF2]
MKKNKIVVLTGAGMSAESGLKTFRDADGLWEGHSIYDVATPEAWQRNPQLVNDFYNQRRQQLLQVVPNQGHLALAQLEDMAEVIIITQNVDDLHERAGSTQVLHLHGELLKVRSSNNRHEIYPWTSDLSATDVDQEGFPLRPHIVWFGEEVPALQAAAKLVQAADYVAVIGTSLQVYPAAGLLYEVRAATPVWYIDPKPAAVPKAHFPLEVWQKTATVGVPEWVEMVRKF